MNSAEKQVSEVVAEIVVSELREGFLGGFLSFFFWEVFEENV